MIRLATLSDIDEICTICDQQGLSNSIGDGHEYAEWFCELLKEITSIFYVYEKNNRVVGFILGEPILTKGSILWSLGICPEYIGRGIGIKLLKFYENECKNRGLNWIYCDGFIETVNSESMKRLGYSTTNSLYKGYFKQL